MSCCIPYMRRSMAQFRTKARAVDLLGKGQIADLPTAISELWKNGYDAYAKKLKCNLYLPGYKDVRNPVFTLSDDGFGMSEADILNKWIVLGTDSKAKGVTLYSDEERFGLEQRIPMGEKGIGRLSVAYLGSPMLMLTKKKDQVCQALLIDWRILENYNLFVDNVSIPVSAIFDSELLDIVLRDMKATLLTNLDDRDVWSEQADLCTTIEKSINNLSIPEAIVAEVLSCFWDAEYHGTTFIIFQPNEQLLDLDEFNPNDQEGDSVSEIQRSLSGIYNLFIDSPDFSTEFNIVNAAGPYNLINDFFDRKDFDKADHYIKGHVDDTGLFVGTIRVFNQTVAYSFRPVRLPGKTPYGSFDLELGEMEGQPKSSLLGPEEYAAMANKTDKFGGLYIYRDKFRVLPYGRTDYDFLKFEERRSKGAGYYFFSHRNMFGYIAISRSGNKDLVDKAGREGLIENKAYREFKKDLIALFVDLGKSFFYTTNSKEKEDDSKTLRAEQIKEIEAKNKRLLEAENKRAKQTKARFNVELKENRKRIGELQSEIIKLKEQLQEKARTLNVTYEEYQSIAQKLNDRKTLLREIKLVKPKRVKLSSMQEKKYAEYLGIYDSISQTAIQCEEDVSRIREIFDVQNLKKDFDTNYALALREISQSAATFRKRFETVSAKFLSAFQEDQREFMEAFKQSVQDLPGLNTKEDYQSAISFIIKSKDEIKTQIYDKYVSFVEHMENLDFEVDDDFLIDWYKKQQETLEQKLEATDQLAQLGISAEIIDHELNVLYARMANSIRILGDYAKSHSAVAETYAQIKVAFEHMEANYKMLQPLYHTTRRQRTEFSGNYLLENVRSFYCSRLDDLNVELSSSEPFKEYKFFTIESVVFSVFINVVNNALYWLVPVRERKIYFDYDPVTQELLLMNSGERIDDRLLEDIFTLFFTRKSNGRGIGLYLARRSLRSIGMDIYATNDPKYNRLGGACFVIKLETGV